MGTSHFHACYIMWLETMVRKTSSITCTVWTHVWTQNDFLDKFFVLRKNLISWYFLCYPRMYRDFSDYFILKTSFECLTLLNWYFHFKVRIFKNWYISIGYQCKNFEEENLSNEYWEIWFNYNWFWFLIHLTYIYDNRND